MALIRIRILALLLLTASGCATNGARPAARDGAAEARGVEVSVRNGTATPLRLLALHGGYETPLGRIGALEDRAVRLPYGVRTVRFVARPSVGTAGNERHHVSEPVSILAGQRVTWELRASPGVSDVPKLSTIRVFACAVRAC